MRKPAKHSHTLSPSLPLVVESLNREATQNPEWHFDFIFVQTATQSSSSEHIWDILDGLAGTSSPTYIAVSVLYRSLS